MTPALVTCYVQQLRLIEVGREAGKVPEADFRAQFHKLVDLAEQALCRMEAVADGYDLFAADDLRRDGEKHRTLESEK